MFVLFGDINEYRQITNHRILGDLESLQCAPNGPPTSEFYMILDDFYNYKKTPVTFDLTRSRTFLISLEISTKFL